MINKFSQYYKRKPIKYALRLAVYERDNFTCQYCGLHLEEDKLQIDHIIPVSRGGTNDINNLVTSCAICNKKKGARLEYPTADKMKELDSVLGTTANGLLDETDDPTPTAGNALTSDSVASEDNRPYTQAQTVNSWMLIYYLGNGQKIELPPTKASYDFLKDIVLRIAHVAVL